LYTPRSNASRAQRHASTGGSAQRCSGAQGDAERPVYVQTRARGDDLNEAVMQVHAQHPNLAEVRAQGCARNLHGQRSLRRGSGTDAVPQALASPLT